MKAYQTAILRYRYDAGAGECLNVGLVFFAPKERLLLFRANRRWGRLKQAFPKLRGGDYSALVQQLDARFKACLERLEKSTDEPQLDALMHAIARPDASVLQWSEMYAGICERLQERFEELYAELVTRWERKVRRERREERQIEVTIAQAFARRGWSEKLLAPTVVEGNEFRYEFKHVWRNGSLQAIEPISLDYEKPQEIVDKANTWVGRLFNLQRAELHVTAVVATPALNGAHAEASQRAIKLLRSAPLMREVVHENELDTFLDGVASELRN